MPLKATTFLVLADVLAWLKIRPTAAKSVTSLTRAGAVATAIIANHGFTDGDTLTVAGAGQAEYNVGQALTIVSQDAVSYAVSGSPATPATGTITASSANDGIAVRIANRVSEDLESWTGRVFLQRAGLTETWNGDNRRSRFLKRFPVTAVSSLTIDSAAVSSVDFAIANADLGQVTLLSRIFPAGIQNCAAVYTAGYAAADVPSHVTGLGLDLCKYIHEQHTANLIQAGSVSAGPASVNIVPGLPRNLRDAIERLKDVRVI